VVQILLLHTNESYAEMLARYVSTEYPSYDVDVVSRVPVPERLRALLAREYDLIQTDELIANGMLATGASVVFDIPLVVAIRGWADYTNAHGQYGWLKDASIRARTRLALHRASEVIFISDTTSETFREQYPVSQYSVVRRPIDIDRYGTDRATDRETFDLLTVTNLRYEEKYDGILTVLRALRPLFEAHPTLRYRVAGGGQYLDALRKYLGDYEYADRVTVLLGFVDAVEGEFASANAFVYVSFLDSYGTVVLEAQAAGLPVIGGDAMGVPEAVGDAGEVCPRHLTASAMHSTPHTDDDHHESLATQSGKKMATYNEERAAGHVDVWERVLDT